MEPAPTWEIELLAGYSSARVPDPGFRLVKIIGTDDRHGSPYPAFRLVDSALHPRILKSVIVGTVRDDTPSKGRLKEGAC